MTQRPLRREERVTLSRAPQGNQRRTKHPTGGGGRDVLERPYTVGGGGVAPTNPPPPPRASFEQGGGGGEGVLDPKLGVPKMA